MPYRDEGVYAFQRIGELWETSVLLPAGEEAEGIYGGGVGIDGRTLVVGAPMRGHVGQGTADVFELPSPSPFQPFGFGDGSFRPCPCNNDSEPGSGEGCANSTGVGARLVGTGSASLAADDMVIQASQLPPGKWTQLIIGQNRLQGLAFGDGLRIAKVPFIRIPLQLSSLQGEATWTGLHGTGFWGAGDVRFFQAFYRDPDGPCGSGFNLTGALQVVFAP